MKKLTLHHNFVRSLSDLIFGNELPKIVKQLEDGICDNDYVQLTVSGKQTFCGFDIIIKATRDHFVEYKNLKPYVWYPKDWYDGNPRGYLIVEHRGYDTAVEECDYNGSLDCDTECFMYVERPKDLVTIRHQREMEYENG